MDLNGGNTAGYATAALKLHAEFAYFFLGLLEDSCGSAGDQDLLVHAAGLRRRFIIIAPSCNL